MYIENPKNHAQKVGWIEVICGSMFSGKTEELIRRLKRAKIANQKVIIFKPKIDNRYSDDEIVSHDKNKIDSIIVKNSYEIIENIGNAEVVGIDEIQFFDDNIIDVVNNLANRGLRIIIAGLDMDFNGLPFGVMPNLLAIAEYITKLNAICVNCGNSAYVSFRLSNEQEKIVLGEKDKYKPFCRKCFIEQRK